MSEEGPFWELEELPDLCAVAGPSLLASTPARLQVIPRVQREPGIWGCAEHSPRSRCRHDPVAPWTGPLGRWAAAGTQDQAQVFLPLHVTGCPTHLLCAAGTSSRRLTQPPIPEVDLFLGWGRHQRKAGVRKKTAPSKPAWGAGGRWPPRRSGAGHGLGGQLCSSGTPQAGSGHPQGHSWDGNSS